MAMKWLGKVSWRPLIDHRRPSGHARTMTEDRAAALLLRVSESAPASMLRLLATTEQGLPESDVTRRLEQHGKNEVAHERPLPWYWMFLHNFRNPFVVVLMVLGLVSYLTEDMKGTIVVSLMVGVSVLMRFMQEFRSSRAADHQQRQQFPPSRRGAGSLEMPIVMPHAYGGTPDPSSGCHSNGKQDHP